jgi:GntR family transcriptional repressor for pyruvate dehydrogenase complex
LFVKAANANAGFPRDTPEGPLQATDHYRIANPPRSSTNGTIQPLVHRRDDVLIERQNFKPVRTKRAFEEICEQIRGEIQSGALSAGDKLPDERELAELFHVSRSTLREAFRALEMAGILTLHKGVKGGAVLLQGNTKPITQTMEDLLSLNGLSLKEYTEARVCVQRAIIRLACERAKEEDFARLEDNISRMRARGPQITADERLQLTKEFCDLLARATKNRAMSALMSAFTEPFAHYLKQIGPDRTWDVAASRSKFVRHLRARNADAAIAEMVGHMQRLHMFLLKHQARHAAAAQ